MVLKPPAGLLERAVGLEAGFLLLTDRKAGLVWCCGGTGQWRHRAVALLWRDLGQGAGSLAGGGEGHAQGSSRIWVLTDAHGLTWPHGGRGGQGGQPPPCEEMR